MVLRALQNQGVSSVLILAKLGVEGSNPFARSNFLPTIRILGHQPLALMACPWGEGQGKIAEGREDHRLQRNCWGDALAMETLG